MSREVQMSGSPQRIIELKLPLTYLLSLVGALAILILTMYMKGEKAAEEIVALRLDIKELRGELKARNDALMTQSKDVSLLTFRVGTIERDMDVMKQLENVKGKK